jgi:hypothetical protein
VLWFGVGDVGGGEEGCWAEEVLGGVLMGWMD